MKSIKDIKSDFDNTDLEHLENFIEEYKNDTRNGVINLVKKAYKKIDDYKMELERVENMLSYEKQYSQYEYICGIDEVGRGPLAGPVVACAVILPKDMRIPYINDSKKLSAKKREELYDIIINNAITYGIGIVSHEDIDDINILQATYKAMRIAISNLKMAPEVLLNDAVKIPEVDDTIIQVPIVKGDAKSQSIAAASIVAKVVRDRMMVELSEKYPEYGFADNKGYGSQKHIEALKTAGPCEIHRKTFIKNLI